MSLRRQLKILGQWKCYITAPKCNKHPQPWNICHKKVL